jgi:hypothetical protein
MKEKANSASLGMVTPVRASVVDVRFCDIERLRGCGYSGRFRLKARFHPFCACWSPSPREVNSTSVFTARRVVIGEGNNVTQFRLGVKHPIAFYSSPAYSVNMNGRKFPRNQKPVAVSSPSAARSNQSRIDLAPATEALGDKACFNYANQGSSAGQDGKLQDAEAGLFGGIVREAQMRPGSPLFKTESYKQDSTATIKESLSD